MYIPKNIKDKKRWAKRHTLDGNAVCMYENMQGRASGVKGGKAYEDIELTFSKEEFMIFLKDTNYKKIFTRWEKSKFARKYAPSVDRIDRLGHYSIDNIQIMTLGENSTKGNAERRICSECGHTNY